MNRATWLKLAGASALALPLLQPQPADAILGIVYDPAVYAGVLKTLANDFIHNKNELMMINMLLQQWQELRNSHHLNIGMVWNDVQPTINKFNEQLAKNDAISQTTKDVYLAIRQTFPDFNPNAPIPYLIELYRQYMKDSAHNVIVANEAAKQSISDQAKRVTDIQNRAANATSDADRFQGTLEMSAATNQAIGMLHSSVTSLVGLYARYVSEKAAHEQASQDNGRLLFAQQIMTQTDATLTKAGQPAHTVSDYMKNPALLPKPVIPN